MIHLCLWFPSSCNTKPFSFEEMAAFQTAAILPTSIFPVLKESKVAYCFPQELDSCKNECWFCSWLHYKLWELLEVIRMHDHQSIFGGVQSTFYAVLLRMKSYKIPQSKCKSQLLPRLRLPSNVLILKVFPNSGLFHYIYYLPCMLAIGSFRIRNLPHCRNPQRVFQVILQGHWSIDAHQCTCTLPHPPPPPTF